METTFIYALNDPETGECRYVGKADDPHDRLFGKNGHLKKCQHLKHHCANWIRSLVTRGLVPHLEILQEVPVADWPLWERVWIKASRKIGMDLTNATGGGEGLGSGSAHPCFGKRPHNFGKKASPEVCARLSIARKGSVPPNKGKKASPELCAKLSAMRIGQKTSLGRKRLKASSKFVGVCFLTAANKWRASINKDYKRIPIGRFTNEMDAARAYDAVAKQYLGESAKLNFPNE